MQNITIGLLIEAATLKFSNEILAGVKAASRELGNNLIRFTLARDFLTQKTLKYHTELIYRIIEKSRIDGLIFIGWWEKYDTDAQVSEFKNRFAHCHLLSIGRQLNGIPSVFMDGSTYIMEMTRHLIEVHNLKKIVCIPPLHMDSRVSFYWQIMQEYGLADPALLITDKEFAEISISSISGRAQRILEILLEKHGLKIDAIISLYSREASQIVKQLTAQGIRVPGDIAVISYEDGREAQFVIPPLTTIYYPFYEQGYTACKLLIDIIQKKPVAMATRVPGRLIFRGSCGCRQPGTGLRVLQSSHPAAKRFFDLTQEEQNAICDLLRTNTGLPDVALFWNKLLSGLQNKKTETLLSYLEQYLETNGNNPDQIYNKSADFRTIYKTLLPYLANEFELLQLFDDICARMQLRIQERFKQTLGLTQLSIDERNALFDELSQKIVTTYNVAELLDVLAGDLQLLRIPGCFIFLYNAAQQEPAYRLAFAYIDNRRIDPASVDPSFWQDGISIDLIPHNTRCTMLLNHLHIEDEQIGFIIFESGSPPHQDERLYYSLTVHISTALKSALLVEKYREANHELKAAQKQLVDDAFKAGMAKIALGTLHNTGNILNSLNTSLDMLGKHLDDLHIPGLKNSAALSGKTWATRDTFLRRILKEKCLSNT